MGVICHLGGRFCDREVPGFLKVGHLETISGVSYYALPSFSSPISLENPWVERKSSGERGGDGV